MPAPSTPRSDDVVGDPEAPPRRPRKRRSWARRRHLGLITTAVALVVLVAGVLLVVATWDSGRDPVSDQAGVPGTTAASTPAASTPAATSSAPTATTAPGLTTFRVTITAIGDSRWTAIRDSGLTITVLVTPTTTFVKNRDFTSYAVGDTISVEGTLSTGVITAKGITGKPKG